jgi:hypothetical protein
MSSRPMQQAWQAGKQAQSLYGKAIEFSLVISVT